MKMLTPYVSVFPMEAVSLVIEKARGGDVTTALAVRAGYEVLGYGLNLALPYPPLVMGGPVQPPSLSESEQAPAPAAAPVLEMDATKVADALDRHRIHHMARSQGLRTTTADVAALVPWEVLVPMVVNLLMGWLRSKK